MALQHGCEGDSQGTVAAVCAAHTATLSTIARQAWAARARLPHSHMQFAAQRFCLNQYPQHTVMASEQAPSRVQVSLTCVLLSTVVLGSSSS